MAEDYSEREVLQLFGNAHWYVWVMIPPRGYQNAEAAP